ncbi:MAG: heme o synthase [Chloroflexi bacterium]|nr:heme o synthase [Chloroflexota bacterium]
MSIQQQQTIQAGIRPNPSLAKTIVQLFKLRIVTLLLFASLGSSFLAVGSVPTIGELVTLFVAGGLGASGASALNQYLERNSDHAMKRTAERPLVNGTVNAELVLFVSLAMVLVPVGILLFSNPPMAFFILMGAIIYVVVYTVWLKPRSALNIVIGGAAGSCAVLTGSAAVGNWDATGALMLALLVFFWTPAHFWSLAIMVRDDYAAANIPMLPVTTDTRTTAIWGFVHAACVGTLTILLNLDPALGFLYLIPSALMTYYFLKQSWRLIQQPDKTQAKKAFLTSNGFLALILLSICLSVTLGI